MYNALGRRLVAAGLVVSCLIFLLPQLGVVLTFPDQLSARPNEPLSLDVGPFFTLNTLPGDPSAFPPDATRGEFDRVGRGEGPIEPESVSPSAEDAAGGEDRLPPGLPPGEVGATYQVELRLFGRIPLRRADVSVVSPVWVVPGGQAIGILLSSEGLVVTGTAQVATRSGELRSPAAEAGILPGDIILRVGTTPVDHPIQMESITESYGERGAAMPLIIRRGGRELRFTVVPVEGRDPNGGPFRYMLGLYLKDPAAGVGTLTFWDPSRGTYGALGHMVTERGEPLSLAEGKIVAARIHGIHPGAKGRPGEKIGIFESAQPIGTIERNSSFGIFGRLAPAVSLAGAPVPVALSHEVRTGPAVIRTVLDGGRVETFDVEILSVQRQARPTGKGIVLQVTDTRLLDRTHGIVQGMSGSPILQDGKLVGAVTHVFINDPARGFGVLAEWMLQEAAALAEGRTSAWESHSRPAREGLRPIEAKSARTGEVDAACPEIFASSSPTTTKSFASCSPRRSTPRTT